MRNILWWSPVLFLLFTGMSCEDIEVPAIEDFTLTHMDNSGKYPVEATKGKAIKKEAYVLKISLKTEFGSDEWYPEEKLEHAITHIQILTKNKWDDFYPARTDIIDCFKGYQIMGDPNGESDKIPYQSEHLAAYLDFSVGASFLFFKKRRR